MNNLLEFKLDENNLIRFERWLKSDRMKPFGFILKSDDDNMFVINHGAEGGLYDNRTKTIVNLENFYNRISQGKLLGNRHLCLLCCYGGLIDNTIPDKVTIINKTALELEIKPTLEGFTVFVNQEGWYE